MPASTVETPAVALSFANNFWGKEDAGVAPLLSRMTAAKTTCDELRAFYGARASIEEEYSRKLLNLSRKALGSQESGTLKTSLDTVRGEVEQMAKQHQLIGAEMKSELEEPLAAFAGGMKERRKIIQNTVEKLLKVKMQQTQQVNKTRDKYEQECLKIKGYLAQGHMVMGQEERRNKAKLEKTQISLATSNTEYENAVKALEDTTTRWNREWKSAADKFQDLEEERLDFTKSSLWTFANIASTVCVSDDSSCEKIRLSLEVMDVEKDIITFITEKGTGQEIPDAPKYINFCRGDVTDNQSETSEDDNYSVAQFPRSINPAFRSSSPQPSTFESHHDPNSALANDLAHREVASSKRDLPTQKPATLPPDEILQIGTQKPQPQQIQAPPQPRQQQIQRPSQMQHPAQLQYAPQHQHPSQLQHHSQLQHPSQLQHHPQQQYSPSASATVPAGCSPCRAPHATADEASGNETRRWQIWRYETLEHATSRYATARSKTVFGNAPLRGSSAFHAVSTQC
ncbi:formin-binding protein [Fusarium oxysporum]|nr:formin-binding protein [Fusarium oxysporum]